jgi:nucleoside-diphosphate-sugar epimerase
MTDKEEKIMTDKKEEKKDLDPPGNGILVLVTGASGYIAGHVVKLLLDRGYKVRGTVRNLKRKKDLAHLLALPEAQQRLELVEADLLKPDTWPPAVAGCSFVLHTASPFVIGEVADENILIKPAVEGTLNVLKACANAKEVKRVVLTSSEVAIAKGYSAEYESTHVFDENDWSVVDRIPAYPKSKLLAEKAAWDYMKQLREQQEQ